jgi:DMSO reductase anchor subunit
MPDGERRETRDASGGSFYFTFLSVPFLLIAALLGLTFVHAAPLARHFWNEPGQRSGSPVVASILTGIFFVGVCLHRWRIRQILRTSQIDHALLSEMASMLIWVTAGFCISTVVLLHPLQ